MFRTPSKQEEHIGDFAHLARMIGDPRSQDYVTGQLIEILENSINGTYEKKTVEEYVNPQLISYSAVHPIVQAALKAILADKTHSDLHKLINQVLAATIAESRLSKP